MNNLNAFDKTNKESFLIKLRAILKINSTAQKQNTTNISIYSCMIKLVSIWNVSGDETLT